MIFIACLKLSKTVLLFFAHCLTGPLAFLRFLLSAAKNPEVSAQVNV